MPRMDEIFGQHLACLRGDDFQAALPHKGVVDVVELRPFADYEGLVELDLHAGPVSKPGDRADGAHAVTADDDVVFGLECPEFVKIDSGRVGDVLVGAVHAVGDTRKGAEECNQRNVANGPVRKLHMGKISKKVRPRGVVRVDKKVVISIFGSPILIGTLPGPMSVSGR